jgi:hypothetical protein
MRAGLHGEKDAADIQAGADNLLRLASAGRGAGPGNADPSHLLRLEDKKPGENNNAGDVA